MHACLDGCVMHSLTDPFSERDYIRTFKTWQKKISYGQGHRLIYMGTISFGRYKV